MAVEAGTTTTESVGSAIQSEWINPTFSAYARERIIGSRFLREYDLRGKGSAKARQPRIDPVLDVGDHGDSAADFQNVTEGDELALTEFELTHADVEPGEYGVAFGVTYSSLEDVIADLPLMLELLRYAATILMTAFEDDVCGQLSGFDETIGGGTAAGMTVEDADEAIATLVDLGVLAPAGTFVAILHSAQGEELFQALKAANSNQAVYPGTADALMAVRGSEDNGSASGLVVVYRGVPFFKSGLCDTADNGDSLVGGMFVRGDLPVSEEWAALGKALSRDVMLEMDRVIRRRRNDVVASTRMGVDVLNGAFGVTINTATPAVAS